MRWLRIDKYMFVPFESHETKAQDGTRFIAAAAPQNHTYAHCFYVKLNVSQRTSGSPLFRPFSAAITLEKLIHKLNIKSNICSFPEDIKGLFYILLPTL